MRITIQTAIIPHAARFTVNYQLFTINSTRFFVMKNNKLLGMLRIFVLTIFCLQFTVHLFSAPLRIENVTRLKGQEPTTIRGYGIVSGLNGTGDDPKAYDETARRIIRMFELSGMPNASLKGIGTSKNNALVGVSATIPATGGRDGDLLDCTLVSVGNAKSIENGVLSATMLTSLLPQGPEAEVLGTAWGKVTIEKASAPNVGKIKRGCRLLSDSFINPYVEDGNLTLVMKQEYSDPRMAIYVANAINQFWGDNEPETSTVTANQRYGGTIAKAIDSHFVIVKLPKQYFDNPLQFVSELMNVEITVVEPLMPRVVINERVGIISIDEGVEVKPTVVTHRNIVAEIRPPVPPGQQEENPQQFIDIDTDVKYRQMMGEAVTNQKLKALQASLDAVRVTPQDMIEIIKILEQQGALLGDVHYIE
ncbi:MAG: flagellar basal body P-ring protein FlgI [Planctomycetaceae bacterium]|jgi:flagellar P-ring protein precursor FlgI|nr:flagellar basal body P-ring protein FlgI [Planctomycetaceae bacterium]